MYATRKHLGSLADKQAFAFPQVYVSKPPQQSEQGTQSSSSPSSPLSWLRREKTPLKCELPSSLPAHDPIALAQKHTQALRSQLHRKLAANPAFSDWGLFCKITCALSLFTHKGMCFFSDRENTLVNHKTVLPSGFAQIGLFLLSARVYYFFQVSWYRLLLPGLHLFLQQVKSIFKPLHLQLIFHPVIFWKQLQQLSCRVASLSHYLRNGRKCIYPKEFSDNNAMVILVTVTGPSGRQVGRGKYGYSPFSSVYSWHSCLFYFLNRSSFTLDLLI